MGKFGYNLSHIDGLVQSIANALELSFFCIEPSM